MEPDPSSVLPGPLDGLLDTVRVESGPNQAPEGFFQEPHQRGPRGLKDNSSAPVLYWHRETMTVTLTDERAGLFKLKPETPAAPPAPVCVITNALAAICLIAALIYMQLCF